MKPTVAPQDALQHDLDELWGNRPFASGKKRKQIADDSDSRVESWFEGEWMMFFLF